MDPSLLQGLKPTRLNGSLSFPSFLLLRKILRFAISSSYFDASALPHPPSPGAEDSFQQIEFDTDDGSEEDADRLPPTPKNDPEKNKIDGAEGNPMIRETGIPTEILAMSDEVERGMRQSIENELKDLTRSTPTDVYQGSRAEFRQGAEAFSRNDLTEAKRLLRPLELQPGPYATIAQKILADIYYREKNYREAVKYFQVYAMAAPNPRTDWQLLHFYLRDYQNSKIAFWNLLEDILAQNHQFKQEAQMLKVQLDNVGVRPD